MVKYTKLQHPSRTIQAPAKKFGNHQKKHANKQQNLDLFCKFTIKITCCTDLLRRVYREILNGKGFWGLWEGHPHISRKRPLAFIRRLPSSLDISHIMEGDFQNISMGDNRLFAYNSGFSWVTWLRLLVWQTIFRKWGSVRRVKGQ